MKNNTKVVYTSVGELLAQLRKLTGKNVNVELEKTLTNQYRYQSSYLKRSDDDLYLPIRLGAFDNPGYKSGIVNFFEMQNAIFVQTKKRFSMHGGKNHPSEWGKWDVANPNLVFRIGEKPQNGWMYVDSSPILCKLPKQYLVIDAKTELIGSQHKKFNKVEQYEFSTDTIREDDCDGFDYPYGYYQKNFALCLKENEVLQIPLAISLEELLQPQEITGWEEKTRDVKTIFGRKTISFTVTHNYENSQEAKQLLHTAVCNIAKEQEATHHTPNNNGRNKNDDGEGK